MKMAAIRWSLFLALLAGIHPAQAQGGDKPLREEAKTGFSPDQQATLRSKQLALALDLNAAQQAKVKSVLAETIKKRDELRQTRDKLRQSDRKPSPEQRFAMRDAVLDLGLKHQAQMKEILTENQYQRWKDMQRKRMARREGKGHMPPANPPRRGRPW